MDTSKEKMKQVETPGAPIVTTVVKELSKELVVDTMAGLAANETTKYIADRHDLSQSSQVLLNMGLNVFSQLGVRVASGDFNIGKSRKSSSVAQTADDIAYSKHWDDLEMGKHSNTPGMDAVDAAKYQIGLGKLDANISISKVNPNEILDIRKVEIGKMKGLLSEVEWKGGIKSEGSGPASKIYTIDDFTKEMDELPHVKVSVTAKEQIINIPKGEKPDPSLYINSSEIAEHLSLFNDGAVRIQSKESYEKAIQLYGSNIGDPVTGTFVLPKNVVDKAIEASNGNTKILEELLGLDQGYLGDRPIILEIQNPSNLRMPSGNEVGAWPEYWIPGGYTSGGVPEAVVDQIPSGGYVVSDIYYKK